VPASTKPAERPAHLKPLAPTTYLWRNFGKSAPLTSVIVLAVLLVAGIVSLMDSIPLSIRTIYSYSRHMLGVSPRGDPAMLPKLRAEIEEGSPVPLDRVVVCRASGAIVNSIVGKWPFVVLGLSAEDMRFYLDRLGTSNLVGRLPEPGKPEAVISAPVAKNLKLRVGDALLSPNERERYSPFEVKVVGIALTSEWAMLGDIEYQKSNHFPPIDYLLVFAKSRRDQEALDRWAEAKFKGERAQLFAYHLLEKDTNEMFDTLYKILNLVIGVLVLVITVMMGMLMNIYQSQRLVEFGLLQAIGYTRAQLLGRMLRETALVIAGGWALGVASAYGLLLAARAAYMEPNAYALDPLDRVAYLYTVPIPVAVLAAATLTVVLRFRRFDPVAVVERRIV